MYPIRILTVFSFLTFLTSGLFAQGGDSITIKQDVEEVKIIENFNWKYEHRLAKMRRVYPLALSAKEMIVAHKEELEGISKKRQRKKLGKKTHKQLKDEFSYNIRDLYRSEGRLLIRLIHRETGMTVAEIIETFEGKTRRKWYNGMAKMGGQDLESEYDPSGKDYITELIIEEIEAGTISFSLDAETVDKTDYKQGMKEYREGRKENSKKMKEYRRNQRKKK